MPLKFHPRPGQLLMCKFEPGFLKPEMVKTRPVVVISPSIQGRAGLVTVVPLSTRAPNPVSDYHMLLPKAVLPKIGLFQNAAENWVKGDMVYTVGFHRLDLIELSIRGADGKRKYFDQRLSRETMRDIYTCVLHGMGFGSLANYLPK